MKRDEFERKVRHPQAVIIYEAMQKFAEDNEFRHGMEYLSEQIPLVEETFRDKRGNPNIYMMRECLGYLRKIGSIKQPAPTRKVLVRHPNECVTFNDAGEVVATANTCPDCGKTFKPSFYDTHRRKAHGVYKRSGPTIVPFREPRTTSPEVKIPDTFDEISPRDLADSVARQMWERYEWALAEIGKAHAALELKEVEIARLKLRISEQEEVGVTEAARLILHGKKK